jgi:hypothetical protein
MPDIQYEDDYDRHYRKIKVKAIPICKHCDQSSPDALPIHSSQDGALEYWLCPECWQKQLADWDKFFSGE